MAAIWRWSIIRIRIRSAVRVATRGKRILATVQGPLSVPVNYHTSVYELAHTGQAVEAVSYVSDCEGRMLILTRTIAREPEIWTAHLQRY